MYQCHSNLCLSCNVDVSASQKSLSFLEYLFISVTGIFVLLGILLCQRHRNLDLIGILLYQRHRNLDLLGILMYQRLYQQAPGPYSGFFVGVCVCVGGGGGGWGVRTSRIGTK